MVVRRWIYALVVLQVTVTQIPVSGQGVNKEDPWAECLRCICIGSSNCQVSGEICKTRPCGPYMITEGYWIDAGRPVLPNYQPTSNGAFAACASNKACSEETVKGYMSRYAQDCDRNGIIDCDDFARMHVLGAYSCTDSVAGKPFFPVYERCKARRG